MTKDIIIMMIMNSILQTKNTSKPNLFVFYFKRLNELIFFSNFIK